MGSRNRRARRVMEDTSAGRVLAASASLGAAGIHLASGPVHYSEWWLAGVFFYAVAVLQAGWAMAVVRLPGRLTMAVGLAANAGVIAVWAVSRATGIPAGPHAGVAESVGQAGLTAVALEVLVVLTAMWHLRRRPPRGFASALRAATVIVAASTAVAAATLPAVQATTSHGHGGAGEPAPHGHGRESEEDPHSPAPETPSSPEPATGRPSPSAEPSASAAPHDGHGGHEH